MGCVARVLACVLGLTVLCLDAGPVSEAEHHALRETQRAKVRRMLHDNDGCDMLYLDRRWKATEDDFIASRIGYLKGTRVETMIYTPVSSGFCQFSVPDVGDTIRQTIPYQNTRNAVAEFEAQGTDCLKMAISFARRENKEILVGIRMNDTHDDCHDPACPKPDLFPPWKSEHPEVLFGGPEKERRPPRSSWSAVDFDHEIVRERLKSCMARFFGRYDLDGVCYDFLRHLQLFKSVAYGAHATAQQIAKLTQLMRDLRRIADEAGCRTGRPKLTVVRVPDSIDFCRAVGIDLVAWMDEGLVDIVVGGGEFQLNPTHVMARAVHDHGCRYLASIADSRIGEVSFWRKWSVIDGRTDWRTFYPARMAAAMASGADGVQFFNFQNQPLAEIGCLDPLRLEGVDKKYFAIEYGSGGAQPAWYLADANNYRNMPDLDPAWPHQISAGGTYSFEMTIGDDLDARPSDAPHPTVAARVLTDHWRRQDVRLTVNGVDMGDAVDFITKPTCENYHCGLYAFAVPACAVRRGVNAFAATLPCDWAGGKTMFVDFMLEISYGRKGEK